MSAEPHASPASAAPPPSPFHVEWWRGARGRRTFIGITLLLLAAAFWPYIHPKLPIRAAVNGAPVGPWTEADENEMRRLNRIGYFAGDTIELRVIGTVPRNTNTAQLILDLNRDNAVRAGIAGRAIYPGLPADSLYVLAGPYRPPLNPNDERDIRIAARKRWSRTPRRVRLAIRDGDPPGPGELSRVAETEYHRLAWEDDLDWPVYPVRIAGVYPESELAAASRRRRLVGSASLAAGIANHEVYQGLEPGKVYVIIGPYQTKSMQWAERRIPRLERETGERFRPRTLRLQPRF